MQIFEGAYEVVVDGEEAVREANAVRADLILMDIALPELNGLEAVPAIRQDRDLAETPIVAVSSRVMPGREEALSAGCDAFVAKPMDDSELLGLVDGFLRR